MSTPVPCTAQVLLVLSADGKGIVMRPGGLRTIPFVLARQALAVCWYATAGTTPPMPRPAGGSPPGTQRRPSRPAPT